jgi:hypothetical protein
VVCAFYGQVDTFQMRLCQIETWNFATIVLGEPMQYTLTLHEDAWLRDGPVFASGRVTGYRVGGMPDGRTARIANFGAPSRNDWRIMLRINSDNTQSSWTGHFESVEEALAALQEHHQ